jgi:hypothetical protein
MFLVVMYGCYLCGDENGESMAAFLACFFLLFWDSKQRMTAQTYSYVHTLIT